MNWYASLKFDVCEDEAVVPIIQADGLYESKALESDNNENFAEGQSHIGRKAMLSIKKKGGPASCFAGSPLRDSE